MTIHEHINSFAGFPIHEYKSGESFAGKGQAIRIALDWEAHDSGKTFEDLFDAFMSDPSFAEVPAIVIGDWGGTGEGNDSAPVIEALVNASDRLPNLVALFVGEMTMEESEISWINQCNVSPLFEAFPRLEQLYLRGGADLRLGRPRHSRLTKLVIETGGLSANTVGEVAVAFLPQLEHLELWLGDDGYGNDTSADDLRPLLAVDRFPKLKYLGLRNDCCADQTAKLISEVGLAPSIETLDLSLGTLGDEGAQALIQAGTLGVKKLDIHFHYVSPAVVEQLRQIVPELDASDVQKPDEYDGEQHRYVSVSE